MSQKYNIDEARKFLGTVFEYAEGFPLLIAEKNEIEVTDRLEEDMLKDSPWTTTVSYLDGKGECWAIPIVVSNTKAAALVEAGFNPSFELVSNSGKPTIKVWMLEEPITEGANLIPSDVSV